MNESKPYPQIEEEDSSSLTAQESGGVAYAYSDSQIAEVLYEVPGLPKSWEELQELIEDGEQEYERGETIPWETATKRMKAHIKEYAA